MNKNNFIAIMSIVAAISLSVGAVTPVLAASHLNNTGTDNMTMGTDNMTTAGADNATALTPIDEIPSDNTTLMTDTERGFDANVIQGEPIPEPQTQQQQQ